jgi:hypothetical protein
MLSGLVAALLRCVCVVQRALFTRETQRAQRRHRVVVDVVCVFSEIEARLNISTLGNRRMDQLYPSRAQKNILEKVLDMIARATL